MKILKITFENIHSLQGRHEVNFAEGPLADAGLFAITGPTGSGKSTLLDVITLALYNRIARVDGNISNTTVDDDGGIMTRNTTHCFAEVEYRVKGKTYCSHWSIERNRNNNLKNRKQELSDLATGEILMEGTKTPQKNEEVIGLTYDQFVKAMVLAQGEFSKLLKAKREERNRLLEDITGARSYRNIGIAVYQRYAGILKKIDLKKAELSGIEILSEEEINQQKESLKELNEKRSKIDEAYNSASANVKTRRDLIQKNQEQEAVKQQVDGLQKDYDIYKPYGEQLAIHDKLCVFEDDLRTYDTAINEHQKLENEVQQLQTKKTEEEKNRENCVSNITNLIGREVNVENATDELETFKNQILELQNREKSFAQSAQMHKSQLDNFVAQISSFGYDLATANTPENFEPLKLEFEKSLAKEIELAGVNSETELDDVIKSKRINEGKAAEFLNKKEVLALELEKRAKNKKEWAENEKTLETNKEEIIALKKELEILSVEISGMEQKISEKREHQSLEQFRDRLQPDEPCPLCGSKHHPYAAHQPVFDVEEELLNQKKENHKNKNNLVVSKSANSEMLIALNEKLKQELADLESRIGQMEFDIAAMAQQLGWNADETIPNLKTKKSELSTQIANLEKFKKAFRSREILKLIDDNFSKWKTDIDSFRKVNQHRKELYANDDIVHISQKLSSQLTHCIAGLRAIEEQINLGNEKLNKLQNHRITATKKIEEILTAQKIESIDVLRKSILKPDTAKRIRDRKQELETKKARIDEQQKRIEKELAELQAKDNPEVSIEELTTIYENVKTQRENNLMLIGRLEQSLKSNQEAMQRHSAGIQILEVLEKDRALWETMNKLIGDARGSKFSNFVQDLTLEQLIGYTNRRLQDFTDRYIIDIPTADEAAKSDTLKVFDNYMGNTRRSVNTLSGGETFLLSLAMAFALSDIAARNVKIESLFIDEGFGTLDAETLDQAITILEKIQSEGEKSVGVISHVDALKERITTQIRLEKSNLGHSSISIVQ